MVKYYKKKRTIHKNLVLKIVSALFLFVGLAVLTYAFLPIISWQIYFAPVFANQELNSPIPKVNIVSGDTIASLISGASQSLSGVDLNNAQNWFPRYTLPSKAKVEEAETYNISIPKIGIVDAVVSSVDIDLAKHLVNYSGTAIPPDSGNAVVFGHSTLPQLYDAKNYKTIFTNLYKLTAGDEITVNVNTVTYKYKVETITVVDPTNTSVLEQNYNGSFLTLITCTPPGTIWKRLVVKARLEKV